MRNLENLVGTAHEEMVLEQFKDWYLLWMKEQMAIESTDYPLTKQIQMLESDDELSAFKEDINHYYYIHNANTWADIISIMKEYLRDRDKIYSILIEYIITKTPE